MVEDIGLEVVNKLCAGRRVGVAVVKRGVAVVSRGVAVVSRGPEG